MIELYPVSYLEYNPVRRTMVKPTRVVCDLINKKRRNVNTTLFSSFLFERSKAITLLSVRDARSGEHPNITGVDRNYAVYADANIQISKVSM